jgi:hypothetical protein
MWSIVTYVWLYGMFFQAPEAKNKRVDFDERLIKAEGSKAGTVMLIERKKVHIDSLIKHKIKLRESVLSTVYSKE